MAQPDAHSQDYTMPASAEMQELLLTCCGQSLASQRFRPALLTKTEAVHEAALTISWLASAVRPCSSSSQICFSIS